MNEYNDFDPVLFSTEENYWLLENIDKPTIVALRNLAPGVNPAQVKPLLDRISELDQLERHEGLKWVGTEAIKTAILAYLEQDAKWQSDYKKTRGRAPRFPSLSSFDSKGRAHLGGPGSDSGRVRTYFDKSGKRIPFAISLLVDTIPDWNPPGFGEAGTEIPEDGLKVNDAANRIECFCGHTESFKPNSRASYNASRARMSKHLRKATEEVERHREIHTNEFGG